MKQPIKAGQDRLKPYAALAERSIQPPGLLVGIMSKIGPIITAAGLVAWLFFVSPVQKAHALDVGDVASIGAAYTTHILFHEMGHHVVAEEVGADSPQMSFFTQKGGRLYPGLSTYKEIPEESRLPYAAGGERMAGFTFEYGLGSYHRRPTTFNKALMFFSCADFVAYTLLANYVQPHGKMYDPNLIREETGCSKGMLLSLVLAKSLLNAYRVTHPEANFTPMIWLDKNSAALLLRLTF